MTPLAIRLYRILLRLYPASFRRGYGTGMAEMFSLRLTESARSHGIVGWLRLVAREYLGLLAGVARQRVIDAPKRPPPTRSGPRDKREIIATMLQEIRLAIRRLAKTPGFTSVAVVTVGLGIGANTAIFSLVNAIVLRPLPFPAADRGVRIHHRAPGIGLTGGLELTRGLYVFYRDQGSLLDEVAAYRENEFTITDDGEPIRVPAARATYTLGDVLGVPPLLGRWIRQDDVYADGTGIVVLSHGLWQSRYGADPDILGRSIRIDDVPFEVVGVMPSDFAFPSRDTQLWIPRVIPENTRFGGFGEYGVARLKSGVSALEAQADLNARLPSLPDRFPNARSVIDDAKIGVLLQPMKDYVVGDIEQTLWILLGTVGFVLLIACTNVANLFLVRAEVRQREIAVRTALGASQGHLIRLFLTESCVLTVAGSALGLALAWGSVRGLVWWGPPNIPRLHEVGIDGPVLAFTAAITVAAAVVFGVIPVFHRTHHIGATLRDGGRTVSAGRGQFSARNALVVTQVAVAMVLLVGSGLMVRSFWYLKNVDPGFDASSVLTFDIGLPSAAYPDRQRAAAFQQQLLDRLENLPGVEQAGAVSCLPLLGWCSGDPLYERGAPPDPGIIPPIVARRTVAPGYFEATRIPLLAGRLLDRSDHEQMTNAVVVSARLVELYWPMQDALGKQVFPGSDPEPDQWYTIVGVVGDVQTGKLSDGPSPLVYFPLVSTANSGPPPHIMTFTLRTTTPPLDLVDAVRREVWTLNSSLPLAMVRTLEQLISRASIQTTFTMLLLAIAAGVALLLGAIGVYGVISYVVSKRRNEIGIRIALGATQRDVRRMVLRQGGTAAALGVALGVAGALALTRLMDALLFGVSPTDPITFAAVATILLTTTLVACYVPARRAAGVDPVEALKAE
ncbi:MAG: ABC transporter permease [Gemmatimonadetes bacterium]|nr:ABC transporter permease [Gemmatimonadota bacterium]